MMDPRLETDMYWYHNFAYLDPYLSFLCRDILTKSMNECGELFLCHALRAVGISEWCLSVLIMTTASFRPHVI